MVLAAGVIVGCSDDSTPAMDQRVDQVGGDLSIADAQPPVDQGQTDDAVQPDAAPTEGGTGVDFAISCTANLGTVQVSGSVQGQAVSATHAGGVKVNMSGLIGYGVALLDQGGTCAAASTVIGAPKLWILLCNSAPGTYAIGTSCLGDGGGVSFKNQATIPTPGTDPNATTGTVTITSFDPACGGAVKGSFSLGFAGDQVTGSFDTVGCGTISI